MNKNCFLIFSIFFLFLTGIRAQNSFKEKLNLNLDISGGIGEYVNPWGFSASPKYQINSNLSMGLEYKHLFADFYRENQELNKTETMNSTMSVININAEYFLRAKELDYFVGLGLGYFLIPKKGFPDIDLVKGVSAQQFLDKLNTFGIAPKIGLSFYNVRAYIAYNYLFAKQKNNFSQVTQNVTENPVTTLQTKYVSRNWFEFGIGYTFFKKNK